MLAKLFQTFSDSHSLQALITTVCCFAGIFGLQLDPTAVMAAVSPMFLSIAGAITTKIAWHAAAARVQSTALASGATASQVAAVSVPPREPQKGAVSYALLPLTAIVCTVYMIVIGMNFMGCGANAPAIKAAELQCLAQDLASLTAKAAACVQAGSGGIVTDILCGGQAALTSGEALCALEALGAKATPGSAKPEGTK